MTNFDLTVFYAYHTPEEKDAPAPLQHTLPADRIQIIPVWESDVYHPRKNTLEQLPLALGRFTILLDEDDQFDTAFLERLLRASENEEATLVMPSCISPWLPQKKGYFSLDTTEDLTIDTSKAPTVFPTELHGLLLRTDRLLAALAQLTGPCEPEKQILLQLLTKNPVFLYLGSCTLTYGLPRECDPAYDIRCQTPQWYYDSFRSFLLPYFARTTRKTRNDCLVQHLALYMINVRMISNINNKNKHVIPPEEVSAYGDLFAEVLQYVDEAAILSSAQLSNTAACSTRASLLYLRLKKHDLTWYPDFRCTDDSVSLVCGELEFCGLSSLPLRLIQLDYSGGKLEIDGEYSDYFSDASAEVFAQFDKKTYPLAYNGRYSRAKCFGVTFARMKTFHVSIPVSDADRDRTLNFILKVNGHTYTMEYAFPSQGSRFAKDFSSIYWCFGSYMAFWNRSGIHVVKARRLLMLRKEVKLWLQMWKKPGGIYRNQIPDKIVNFLLRPYFKHKKIWLFLDKIYKGADSSEYIYRYAAKQDDGIKKYYLLDKASADYARMKKDGYQPLVRGTLKHRLIFLNADMVIASNSTVFAFNDYGFVRSLPIRADVHFDVACVQHGMSVQKIAIAQQRLKDNTRLYFCASKYEIENLSKPVYDYIGYDALKLTGVPRYDGLKNRAQKILVLSPTWRMQSVLPVTRSEGVSRDYNPHFTETAYYKVYNSLINDARLLDAARRYGYRIQYVLHPIISPQHDDFVKNDVVEIIPSIGEMSYEKIFCEGALMVTDFSGVQFDFAYMRKPVIYLHHQDIPQHYEEGTFFYETMGFGEICRTNDELIDVLCTYMKNDCVMPQLYRRRADDFFAFSDHHNCERIYPVMLEHERSRSRD